MYSTLNIAGFNVGFFQQLPISIDKSIADIRDPDKRNADFSKTITVPATAEVNILFEFAFDVNIDFQVFNPNIALPGSYFVGTTEVIKGNVQLLAIPQLRDSGSYEIAIKGTNADLFLAMGDKYLVGNSNPLDDLDFSSFNHALNYTNFSATPTLGVGYCYGYIDYGMNGVNGFNWNVLHMKAAIFLLEYINKIFAKIGKTYTSTYFSSAEFSHFAVPCNKPGAYQFSGSLVNNNQFYANKTATQTNSSLSASLSGSTLTYGAGAINPLIFQDDSTPPYNDPGGLYNTGTGAFTVNLTTPHTVTATIIHTFNITVPPSILAGASYFETIYCTTIFEIKKNGTVVSSQTENLFTQNFLVTAGVASFTTQFNISYPAPSDTTGDVYTVDVFGVSISGVFKNSLGVTLTPAAVGGSTMTMTVENNSTYYNTLDSQNLTWGDTIDMNTVVPEEVKMKDFFMWVVKTFNLYIEQDKTNPNNYIIERRNDFYTTGNEIDLDIRHDTSQAWKVIPMGELDAKSYLLSYSEDKDYWNTLYKNNYKEIYGQQLNIIDNDFLKNQKVISVGFSPSPGVAFQTNIVAPRMLSIEGNFPGGSYVVKPIKTNPRLLWYAGLKSCDLHNLQISASAVLHPSSYPSLNHFDDAYTPSIDLNFGTPREVYYVLPGQQLTSNNFGNSGYRDFFDAIANPNSKIVELYAMLSEQDIYNFTFRRRAYFKGSYFYVNKISGYDPQTQAPVLMELLKVPIPKAYTSIIYNPYNPPGGAQRTLTINTQFTNDGNYSNYGSASIGKNLINGAQFGIMTGQNSSVDRGVAQVDVIGGNNMLIGPADEGTVILKNRGLIVSDRGMEKVKLASEAAHTANFTANKPLNFVDATGGNIDIKLPAVTDLVQTTIVRIDNSGNTVTVTGPGGTELIKSNGVSATTNTIPTRTTRTYNTDGTSYFY